MVARKLDVSECFCAEKLWDKSACKFESKAVPGCLVLSKWSSIFLVEKLIHMKLACTCTLLEQIT